MKIASGIRFTEGTFNSLTFISTVCKKSSQEGPTILEVLQGQIGCVVPLRASQSAKEQIKGRIVDAEIKG